MDNRVILLTDQVIDAINEELAYQAGRAQAGRTDGVHYGTAGQILTLQDYSWRALAAWVQNPGNDAALHELRKCAAIAIRALLTERCPHRTPTGAILASEDYVDPEGHKAGDAFPDASGSGGRGPGWAPEVGAGAGD